MCKIAIKDYVRSAFEASLSAPDIHNSYLRWHRACVSRLILRADTTQDACFKNRSGCCFDQRGVCNPSLALSLAPVIEPAFTKGNNIKAIEALNRRFLVFKNAMTGHSSYTPDDINYGEIWVEIVCVTSMQSLIQDFLLITLWMDVLYSPVFHQTIVSV